MKKNVAYFCDGCNNVFRKDKLIKTKERWASYSGDNKTCSKYLCEKCLDKFLTSKSDGTKLGFVKAYKYNVCD